MSKNILIENVYYMMAYVFDNAQISKSMQSSFEDFDYLSQLYAAVLNNLLSKQIKQGIVKDYIENTEELSSIKGKFNFAQTIKNNSLISKIVVCEFDEYSEDNLSNQIIKSTLLNMLQDKEILKNSKQTIKKHLLHFSSVKEININNIDYSSVKLNRNYNSYKFMLNICYLYQKQKLISAEDGNQASFDIFNHEELHNLFEKFVLKYYIVHHPHFLAKSIIMRWNDDQENSILPIMKTDITLYAKNHTAIIDTKFYGQMLRGQYTQKVNTNHLYQIYSYISNFQLKNKIETSGVILYAQTKNELSLNQREEINGHSIHIKSINLNQKFDGIKENLDSLIDKLFN